MGKVYQEITDKWQQWISKQQMFFVATAPLSEEGHINLSPKGIDTFRVLSPTTVAYLDLTGSGVETIAHLQENGRIVIMFCAFDGAPNIFRLYGKGLVFRKDSQEYTALIDHFPVYPGIRSIIKVDVSRIADSCGFGVPLYEYQGQRDMLIQYNERKTEKEIEKYQREKNQESIDGLPGLGWE